MKQITSGALPKITKDQFMDSLDHDGRRIFSRIFDLAENRAFPLHWGTKGFSMNVNKNGVHVAICFGYPPKSVYKQSVYTGLISPGGFLSKMDVDDSEIRQLWDEASNTGLLRPAGKELKAKIDRSYSDEEIQLLISWLEKMAAAIQNHELR